MAHIATVRLSFCNSPKGIKMEKIHIMIILAVFFLPILDGRRSLAGYAFCFCFCRYRMTDNDINALNKLERQDIIRILKDSDLLNSTKFHQTDELRSMLASHVRHGEIKASELYPRQ